MRPAPWKVGELARWTGVSVRTLHYYDEIGLLRPAQTTEAGYRLYTEGDVIRLQQVRSLRNLGFSLAEIKDLLARPEVSPGEVLRMQIAHLKEQIALQQRLCERLEALAGRWGEAGSISTGELLQLIEVMNMMDKYYTPEQTEELREQYAIGYYPNNAKGDGKWHKLDVRVKGGARARTREGYADYK